MESILYLNSYDKPRELPENPDDLLDEGYEETTRPGTPDHIRKFRNPKTGDRIDFNKGKPNAPGWKGEDHWHRYNPNKTGKRSECRRARDAKRDIPVPLSPCARATTCTCRGRPAPGPRLRHFAPPPDPYDEWLDGVSDALASGLRQLRDLRPLRHFGQPLAPTPTADYPPRASRFPGGQRMPCWIRMEIPYRNI